MCVSTLSCRIMWWHVVFVFFKQKTAYEMRISDWSSDVCPSDLSSGRTSSRYFPIGERALAWIEKYRDDVRPELAVGQDDGTLFLTTLGEAFVPNRMKIGRSSCRERACQYV